MQRAARWFRQGTNARHLAYSLGGGSSLVAGSFLWLSRRPLLLEADEDASAWGSAANVFTSKNSSLSERFKTAASSQSQGETTKSQKTSATQPPPPQTKGHSTFDVEGDADADNVFHTWQQATGQISDLCESLSGLDFIGLRSKLLSLAVPSWMSLLPGLLNKLQNELSMAPWSLSWEIWEEAHDPQINPEILWDAQVRISQDLCVEEQLFLRNRRKQTAKALARYLDLPESEVHPDDVPTIAMCGSGGGLRALVAGASSYLSAHESGLFDCVTYTAGVSGSCWLQALYYSDIGQLSHERLIHHLKQRIGIHIAYPPAALKLLNQAPTNKYLLSGFIEKLRGVPDADFGLVDVYGLLLAARLMIPKGELAVNDYDLKVSNQRYYTDDGHQPLPIYTAVRHEIPGDVGDVSNMAKEARFSAKHYDWFQWFEWTPYEFFCEELNAGIPTWAMGRRFSEGSNIKRQNGFALPELRIPLMLGIWGSAFCATLSHYYREIKPLLVAAGFGSLDSMLANKDEDLVKVHPVDPAVIPNFMLGLRNKLPPSCPESIHESTHLQLMDAGMSNNLPIYPLLRPGRDVDIIIAFDASADVKTDNWIKVVDGYARQRNIRGWPMGAGWPAASKSSSDIAKDMDEAEAASAEPAAHSTKTLEVERQRQQNAASSAGDDDDDGDDTHEAPADLGHCTVWVGTTQERAEYMDEPRSRRLGPDASEEWHLTSPNAGIALVYFPFLANEKVKGVDPMKSDFMSTWNFVYTPDQIEEVVSLARANFEEGQAQTKRTIKAVWERKRAARLEKEEQERTFQRACRGLRGRAAVWRNGDVGHGDHFGGGI